jgi:hypothetical protein
MVRGSGTIDIIIAVGAATIAAGAGSIVRIIATGEIARVTGDGGINQRRK